MYSWLGGLLLLVSLAADAHQFQTLALTLEEHEHDLVRVVMKSSLGRDDRPANVTPRIEPDCEPGGSAKQTRNDDLVLRTWMMHCPNGLQGRTLKLLGLGPASPDAVVSLLYLDGSSQIKVLDRQEHWMTMGEKKASHQVRGLVAYLPIGIKHILAGPDHLLFVLCLMLAVASMQSSWIRLLGIVTAFTVAHSLTLAASTLYGMRLPSSSVEAVIALSILLLAVELAHRHRHPEREPGLSLRYPALVAFAFGLLHGFGFAGALSQVGLPEAAAGWALLLFNLGVEVGQLIFVATVLLVYWSASRFIQAPVTKPMPALVTIVGAISAYWFIERLQPVFIL